MVLGAKRWSVYISSKSSLPVLLCSDISATFRTPLKWHVIPSYMSFKYSFNSYLMLSFGVDTYTSHFYFLCKAKELSCWIVSQVDDGECGIASGFGCGGRCGTRKLQFKLRLLVTILSKNLLHLSDFFFFFFRARNTLTLYISIIISFLDGSFERTWVNSLDFMV